MYFEKEKDEDYRIDFDLVKDISRRVGIVLF